MSRLRELIARLAELDDKLAGCMRCGMCMAVCPVYGETGLETSVARGKLALLDGLAREMIRDAEGVRERLGLCLLCGSCEAACPSGVRVMDILLAARAALAEYGGLSPVKKIIFRLLLLHPGLMSLAAGLGARLQWLGLRPVKERPGMATARPPALLQPRALRDRRLPALPREPFQAPEAAEVPGGERVILFPGCVVQTLFPKVGEATLAALRSHGATVLTPPNQVCCGIPALVSGDEKDFAELVAKNVRLFKDVRAEALVTPCATCASTIRHFWPRAEKSLPPDLRGPMLALSAKAMDITEYLADKAPALQEKSAPESAPAKRVAFHDPCHLNKGLGVVRQPRDLLRATPGVELAELPRPGACCGCGGSFTLEHPDLSRAIGKRRSRDVLESGADTVATACPACMLQLMDMLARDKVGAEVRHVVEVYADGLAGRRESPPQPAETTDQKKSTPEV